MTGASGERGQARPGVAAVAACGVLLLGAAVLVAYRPDHGFAARADIDRDQVILLGVRDAFGQRLAHKVILLAALVSVAFARPLRDRLPSFLFPVALWIPRAALAVFFAASARFFWGLDEIAFLSGAGILARNSLLLGMLATILFYLLTARRLRSRLRPVHAAAVVAALLAATAPGFLVTWDLSVANSAFVASVESHFCGVVADGDRLAHGFRLFDLVNPRYGVLLPSLVGAFEHHVRSLSFGDYLHLIRAVQALYLLLAAWLYYLHARRVHLIVLPLVLLFARFHFYQDGILFPNQSPWRMIGFPVAFLSVHLLRRWPARRSAFALGCVEGLALLVNVETGVAIAFGLVVYGCFRYRLWSSPASSAALGAVFLAGIVLAFASFVLSFRIGLGTWPVMGSAWRLAEWMLFWEGEGFGGLELRFDPFALLILGHSVYTLIDTGSRASGEVPFVRSFRACVAATTLLWSAFYFHRPHEWNLSSYYFLYGFLLVDVLRIVSTTALESERRGRLLAVAGLTLGLVVVPQAGRLILSTRDSWRAGMRFLVDGPADGGAVDVSGVYLDAKRAADVVERAELVARQARRERLVYLTTNAFLVAKLCGVYNPFSIYDTFAIRRSEHSELLERLLALDPDVVYFDGPGCLHKGGPQQQAYYERLRRDLSGRYAYAETVGGWDAWRRKSSR